MENAFAVPTSNKLTVYAPPKEIPPDETIWSKVAPPALKSKFSVEPVPTVKLAALIAPTAPPSGSNVAPEFTLTPAVAKSPAAVFTSFPPLTLSVPVKPEKPAETVSVFAPFFA